MPSQLSYQFNQVQTAINQGNLRLAQNLLLKTQELILGDPHLLALSHSLQGNIWLREGKYQQAIAIYQANYHRLEGLERLTVLNNLFQALIKKSELEKQLKYSSLADTIAVAEEIALQAITLAEKMSPSSLTVARAWLNWASLGHNQGLVKAEKILTHNSPSQKQIEMLIRLSQLLPDTSNRLSILFLALSNAEIIKKPLALSWTWGELGKIYEQQGRYEDAFLATEKAIRTGISAKEIIWKWWWQGGRLQEKLNNKIEAQEYYQNALSQLNNLRDDLAGNRILQASLQQEAKLLFKTTLRLLLESQQQEDLKQARSVLQLYHLAEIETYFGDKCDLNLTPPSVITNTPPKNLIYNIILPEALYSIIQTAGSDQLKLVKVSVKQELLEETIQSWHNNLLNPYSFDEKDGQKLYQWLITPITNLIDENENLEFINDGILRSVPMQALRDSQGKYLIEKYSISYSLGLNISASPETPAKKALMFGLTKPISISSQGADYSALANVNWELTRAQEILGGKTFTNQAFNLTQLKQEINSQEIADNYNILHLASHGIFKNNISDSYLISGKGKIPFIELDQILKNNPRSFDIIVLSACETATDSAADLAFLGLAGLGVRAGVPTILGNLWASGDKTNSQIIVDFYDFWKNQKMSKVAALRKAQLMTIKRGTSPHLWAAPILLED
jgi:CHAT domain-containing protein